MADKITTEDDKKRVRALLPSWFKPEPGFRFSYDGSDAIVIGWGGWRSNRDVGSVSVRTSNGTLIHGISDTVFERSSLVFAYLYKGEHHLTSVDKLVESGDFHDSFKSFPSKE
jgi:hypothetical protein